MRVVPADFVEVSVLVEMTHRVAAQKRKGLGVCQLIPEHFKTDCGLLLTRLPEKVDHLTINADRAIRSPAARLSNDFTHAVRELPGDGLAVGHERGQGVLRVEQYQVV